LRPLSLPDPAIHPSHIHLHPLATTDSTAPPTTSPSQRGIYASIDAKSKHH